MKPTAIGMLALLLATAAGTAATQQQQSAAEQESAETTTQETATARAEEAAEQSQVRARTVEATEARSFDETEPEVTAQEQARVDTAIRDALERGDLERARAQALHLANQAARRARKKGTGDTELHALVRQEFELRQRLQLAEIRFLKDRLAALEKRIRDNERMKDTIISRRVKSLRAPAKFMDVPTEAPNSGMPMRVPAVRRTRRSSPRLSPGDTVGFYIPGVLGKTEDGPPIHKDPTGQRPPTMGFPIQIQDDGKVSIPYLGRVAIAGQTIEQAEQTVTKVGRETNIITDSTPVLVTVIQRVHDRQTRPGVAMAESARVPARITGRKSASEFARAFEEYGARQQSASARRQYRILKAEFQTQLQMMEIERDQSRKKLELNLKEFERVKQNFDHGVMSASELHRAEAEVDAARADLRKTEAIITLFRKVMPDSRPQAGGTVPQDTAEPPAKESTEG